MNRRTFITSACGAFLSLPAFAANSAGTQSHKRLLIFVNHLGFYKKHFFPENGFNAKKLPTLLQPFQRHASRLTIIPGLSCISGGDGHKAAHGTLTGVRNNSGSTSPSIDQLIASTAQQGALYNSLCLTPCLSTRHPHWHQFSWGIDKKPVFQEFDSYHVYDKLFQRLSPQRFKRSTTLLDRIGREARRTEKELRGDAREQFQQYLDNIDTLEKDLQKRLQVKIDPKRLPQQPGDNLNYRSECMRNLQTQADFAYFAFLNNLTNVCTLSMPSHDSTIRIDGKLSSQGYHKLSHHGLLDEKIAELHRIELAQTKAIASVVDRLEKTPEGDGSMLDNTLILVAGGMSDANKHSPQGRPTCLIGGRIRHRGLLNGKGIRQTNLYATMATAFGHTADSFSNSNGNFNGELL